MANILSTRELRVEINGVQLVGFSGDDPVIEFPDDDFLEVESGKDGASYATDTGMIGGEVTFKFLPTSPSVKTLLGWRHKWIAGERNNFTASVNDSKLGISVSMDLGYLIRCPVMPVPGMTSFDVTFYFEKIDLPNPGSIKFQGVPASPLSSATGGTGGQGYGSARFSNTVTDNDNPITTSFGLSGTFGFGDAGRAYAADGVDTGAGALGGGFTFTGGGTASVGAGGSSSILPGSVSGRSPSISAAFGLGSGQPASAELETSFPVITGVEGGVSFDGTHFRPGPVTLTESLFRQRLKLF